MVAFPLTQTQQLNAMGRLFLTKEELLSCTQIFIRGNKNFEYWWGFKVALQGRPKTGYTFIALASTAPFLT